MTQGMRTESLFIQKTLFNLFNLSMVSNLEKIACFLLQYKFRNPSAKELTSVWRNSYNVYPLYFAFLNYEAETSTHIHFCYTSQNLNAKTESL